MNESVHLQESEIEGKREREERKRERERGMEGGETDHRTDCRSAGRPRPAAAVAPCHDWREVNITLQRPAPTDRHVCSETIMAQR